MREVAGEASPGALELVRRLREGTLGAVILLTGVGTRALVSAVASEMDPSELVVRLGRVPIVVRGPKPAAVIRELGLAAAVRAPTPNTWREVLSGIDAAGLGLQGRVVAVQEYGIENPELTAGLTERGATVLRVPVYRWALPEDLAPLRAAIARLLTGTVEVALFTSAIQVEHVFRVARDQCEADALNAAFQTVVVGSVGPVCSEALVARGISVDFEASPPKLGSLIREGSRVAGPLARSKRSRVRLS